VRGEHLTERLIERCAQAPQMQAVILVAIAKLALAAIEERLAAIRFDGTHIKRQVPLGRKRRMCNAEHEQEPGVTEMRAHAQ
jgi:hypothetical protein